MKIAVLAGGLSPERDVSLTSGALIAKSLASRGHSVALVDIYFDVDAEKTVFSTDADFSAAIDDSAPDLEKIAEKRSRLRAEAGVRADRASLLGSGVLDLCLKADVTYLALHGGCGENGQIQAALDCLGIRYTGSSYDGCLLAMDKELTKLVFETEHILTPEWICVSPSPDAEEKILKEIGLPCVIKPCCCGSSVGVSLVREKEKLKKALEDASAYRCSVIAERLITGREFSVGVLEGKALPPIEIIPKQGFYDYKNKYQSGMTLEICPAELTPEQTARVSAQAEKVHRALRLGSYSRSDFLLDSTNGDFYCLEANALPGMTPASLLPQEAAAAGIEYGELCERIVLAALNK